MARPAGNTPRKTPIWASFTAGELATEGSHRHSLAIAHFSVLLDHSKPNCATPKLHFAMHLNHVGAAPKRGCGSGYWERSRLQGALKGLRFGTEIEVGALRHVPNARDHPPRGFMPNIPDSATISQIQTGPDLRPPLAVGCIELLGLARNWTRPAFQEVLSHIRRNSQRLRHLDSTSLSSLHLPHQILPLPNSRQSF